MTKQRKQILLLAAGALALYLLYRWYQGQSAGGGQGAGSATGTPAPDTSGSDYASLAGQEQGDVAALQQQNQQLLGQEQSDIAGITSQEQGDVATLTSSLGGLSAPLDTLTSGVSDLTDKVAGIATSQGQTQQDVATLASGYGQLNRAQTTTTHKGGAFYNYYKRVTGKAPPATLSVTNFIYQAWQTGVSAPALKALIAGKKTNHAGNANKHVAHPNPKHTPTAGHHKKTTVTGKQTHPNKGIARKSGVRK